MNFPQTPQYHTAVALLRRLNQGGFQGYFVGGCVRDALLSRPITDYDICTSALPSDLEALFEKTVNTGGDFGTITVIFGEFSYEVTTFRGETTYTDGRHPDAVVFGVSLAEDLARRDFTINAMAYHPDFGISDPFGGEVHLAEGLLTTVGVPEQRFSEDSLRILRGLRFSATLGLVIHQDTADAMLACWDGLRFLPRERITNEMEKLVMGKDIQRLAHLFVVFQEGVFDGLPYLVEAEEGWQLERKLEEISAAPLVKTLRLAMFLSLFCPDSGLLRLSKKDGEEVDFFVTQDCLIWKTPQEFAQFVCQQGRSRVALLLTYQRYHYPYHTEQLMALSQQLAAMSCTSLREMDLSGFDLIAAGVKPGETVGRLLQIALELVVTGVVENEKHLLLEMILGDHPEKPPSG